MSTARRPHFFLTYVTDSPRMNPHSHSIHDKSPIKPAPISTASSTCLTPPGADAFFVVDGAAPPDRPPVDVADKSSVCPILGKEAVGLTIQPFTVDEGQAIGFRADAEEE